MCRFIKCGDKELLEQCEMSESTKEVLTEMLSQNRMILEENYRIIRLIGSPVMIIPFEEKPT